MLFIITIIKAVNKIFMTPKNNYKNCDVFKGLSRIKVNRQYYYNNV
jgi:hypothetical protein